MYRDLPTDRRALLTQLGALVGGVVLTGGEGSLDGSRVKGRLVAAPARPRIHTRSDWRARDPRRAATVQKPGPRFIVVHHTATPNVGRYGKKAAFRLSRVIQRHHMKHNGWDDIGQQFTISRGGHIMEGRNRVLGAVKRGRHVIGAHAANENTKSLGIENEGHYMESVPPERQLDALVELIAWLCHIYELNPKNAIIGHRDVNPTLCPGDKLYALLPELRRRVAVRLRGDLRMHDMAWPEAPDIPADPAPLMPAARYDHGPALGPADPPA